MSLKSLLAESVAVQKADKTNNALFCCVLGESGGGKTHALGTVGEKTLYLLFKGEKHGSSVIRKEGKENIEEILLDFNGTDELAPDDTLARLRSIIQDHAGLEAAGFKAIVIDGLTEVDLCISQTRELKKQCLTKNGDVDHFKVPAVAKQMLHKLVGQLVDLQIKTGIHVITTCILEVKEKDDKGFILDASPKLTTFSVAETALQLFGDRVVVCKVVNSKGEPVYVFDADFSGRRVSKDEVGGIKKQFSFGPRVTSGELPKLMKANLSELIKIKRG